MSKTNLIAVGALNRFMRALAEDSGMRVVFSDSIKEPMRKGNTIHVPKIPDVASDVDIAKLRWFAMRESARWKADGQFNLDAFEGAAAQVFDDVRLEGSNYATYRGDRATIDTALPPVLMQYAEDVAKWVDSQDHVPENMLKFLALTTTAQAAKGEWSGVVGAASNIMATKLPPKVAEYMSKLIDAGYLDRLNETESPHESRMLAEEARKILDIEEEPPQPDDGDGDGDGGSNDENESSREQQPNDGDNDDDGDNDSDDSPADGDGDKPPESDPQDEEGQEGDQPEHDSDGEADSPPDQRECQPEESEPTDDDGDEQPMPSGGELAEPDDAKLGSGNKTGDTVNYRSFIPGENSEDKTTDADVGTEMLDGEGLNIDYDNWTDEYDGPVYYDPEWKRIVTRAEVDRKSRQPKSQAIADQMRRYLHESGANSRVLGNKIRRVLQVRSQAQWEGGHKTGRLHRRSLHRAAAPTLGNGEWNQKIRKRKIDGATYDVAIGMVIDGSGSMGGRKILAAASSAALLCDSIANVLKMPTEVTLFSTSQQTHIREIKRFDERMRADRILASTASAASMGMSCNEDGVAVLDMYERLSVRKEPRKIMIVLSDGQPAGMHVGDSAGFLKRTVDEILDRGDVELYGIGIMSDSVEQFYPDHVVINSPDELERAVLTVVRNKLI